MRTKPAARCFANARSRSPPPRKAGSAARAALAALRLILTACHATVIPNQLALSFADEAYDDMDRLKHPADIEALNALVRQLIDVSQRMM